MGQELPLIVALLLLGCALIYAIRSQNVSANRATPARAPTTPALDEDDIIRVDKMAIIAAIDDVRAAERALARMVGNRSMNPVQKEIADHLRSASMGLKEELHWKRT